MKKEITQERLKELLDYNLETGVFTWKAKSSPLSRVKVGAVAGTISVQGYRVITIDRELHKAHRLVWFYVHGRWPTDQLDHIDQDKDNNRIDNLRECTNAENLQNMKSYRGSSSGFIGVSWFKQGQRWRADIRKDGKLIYLGLFSTEEAAYTAYLQAKREHHTFNPIVRAA